MNPVRLEPSWLEALEGEFCEPYMQQLRDFLLAQKQAGKTVYPPGSQMFAAFDHTPVSQVKVVILGQDPYHGPGQAHGLSFSVPPGVAVPPSLRNIYREIEQELGVSMPTSGCLTHWAAQGVLLLNSVLSVAAAQAASHQGQGWERFTDSAISVVNNQCEHVVFMLWGAYAQRKGSIIDSQRHCVLRAPHPSPLSAHRGFFGCGHFVQANAWLELHGREPVNWAQPGSSE
jgi:uracil-DNA glycosylase